MVNWHTAAFATEKNGEESHITIIFHLYTKYKKCGIFSLFMTSKQKLYISTRLARQAVLDKDELDCLAFSVMCKLMFGCSVMKKATARQYKAMFR
ncbi:MAG: hypothetical protein U0L43_12595, partial [Muribaculaceae bacterium]|nr:hypothetical protein [Muribaculaceae bacterium]